MSSIIGNSSLFGFGGISGINSNPIGSSTQSTPEIEPKNLAEKLDKAEEKTKFDDPLGGFGLSSVISSSPQILGQKTDEIMLSDEAQEEMNYIGGTDGNDKIKASINKENGNIVINVNGQEKEYTPEEAANGFNIDSGNGNDDIDISAILNNFVIDAGEGDNNINLSQGRNIVTTGDGNNTITSNDAHRNKITTGNGNNNINITGENSINTINSGNGKDTISIKGNNSLINSGDGNDAISINGKFNNTNSGNGNNIVSVNGESNSIISGNDNDLVYSNGKNNRINDFGGNNIISANGDGNNIISGKGNDIISANGKDSSIRSMGGDNIILSNGDNSKINAGDGNDVIFANGKEDEIHGNAGDDLIITGNEDASIYGEDGNDTILSGNGDNYIEGGKGNDNIIAGNGNNIIYGLDGNDSISAGNGNNYIDGGQGNDFINVGKGKNTIFGGKGFDFINARNSSGKVFDDNYGMINASKNMDVKRYDSSNSSNLGKSINIEGSDDFKMRVESDLEALRATDSGKKLLSELDKSGKTVTIDQTNAENGYTSVSKSENDKRFITPDGQRGEGTNATISYNPSFRGTKDYVPIGILFHEGVHAYNDVTGTMQPGKQAQENEDGSSRNVYKCERQCVGLSIEDGIEVTHPDGTISAGNPEGLTENAIRAELGLEERTRY